ncbi:hypothetical protein D9M69_412430 [compost metagenome]
MRRAPRRYWPASASRVGASPAARSPSASRHSRRCSGTSGRATANASPSRAEGARLAISTRPSRRATNAASALSSSCATISRALPSSAASRCQRVARAACSWTAPGMSAARRRNSATPRRRAMAAATSCWPDGSSPCSRIGRKRSRPCCRRSMAAPTTAACARHIRPGRGTGCSSGCRRWSRALRPPRKCSTRSSMRSRPAVRPACSSTSSSRQRRSGSSGARALQCGAGRAARARPKVAQGRVAWPLAWAQSWARRASISTPAASSSRSRSKALSSNSWTRLSMAAGSPSVARRSSMRACAASSVPSPSRARRRTNSATSSCWLTAVQSGSAGAFM